MHDVLTIVLGGGRGTRLFPLTHRRSKPAVPIGGKYRLIDVPLSNCLHAGLDRVYVLTQFNSASLNRHVAQTYRLDLFSGGFVEVLAAEQTPEGEQWFQGTADAVRQAARHFRDIDADYLLILAGDHIYRMDFEALIDAHIESDADITIAAQPVDAATAPQMGIFQFDVGGKIVGFEEKPTPARLSTMKTSAPAHSPGSLLTADRPFLASMGIYVFSRDVLYEVLDRDSAVHFGREIIPHALGTYRVHPYLFRGYWADVGTVRSFYDVNLMLTRPDAPFGFFHPRRPIYTHPRFLPAARLHGCHIDAALVAEVDYGLFDHIGLLVSIPFIASKYTGPPSMTSRIVAEVTPSGVASMAKSMAPTIATPIAPPPQMTMRLALLMSLLCQARRPGSRLRGGSEDWSR
jgi:glucose-1-phosphate adenylyltransferase